MGKYVHPDTGDTLTISERISWAIQGLIRNWWFVLAWSGLSFVWWLHPKLFHDSHSFVKWQLLASWLAVTVELIIGIAMIGQTKRDAQIIRYILKLEQQEIEAIEDVLENQEKE